MSVIYEPKGRAKEYSPLACNLYMGCTHGCKYCYAPACMRKSAAEWHSAAVPRKNVIQQLKRDAEKLRGDERPVLFSFLSDPYQPLEGDLHLTRQALEICAENNLKTQVLTKGSHDLVSADFDLMREAKTELGVTFCFSDDLTRQQWETHASPIEERFAILKEAHDRGIYTWISLEPIIVPQEALDVITGMYPYVDFWKVGKINHMKELEKTINWKAFAPVLKRRLDAVGAQYYIKDSLKKYL